MRVLYVCGFATLWWLAPQDSLAQRSEPPQANAASAAEEAEEAQAVAGEEELEARIAALVAGGQSADAIPLAQRAAMTAPDRPEGWERLRTFAGWNSNAEATLEALTQLVRLTPEDRDLRLALAQNLLWAERTEEALPHARWLLQRTEETEPVALEVAAWVLLGEGLRQEARGALNRWIAAAPDAPQPRWILADLSHWSVRWREARDEYQRLTDDEEFGERAIERQRLLDKDHPTSVEATGTFWNDNTGVEYFAFGLRARLQLPARMVASAEFERGRWQQDNGALTGSIGILRGLAGLRLELSDAVQPEVLGGVETDSQDNVAPVLVGRVHVSLFGKLFGRVEVGWDRYRLSLASAAEDVRTTYGRILAYAQPVPWLFIGFDGSYSRLSDGNARLYSVLAVGVHNEHAFQVEPRVFVQTEHWSFLHEDSFPYFTTPDPVAVGGDVTLRYTREDWWLRAELAMGVVYQGGNWALTPKGLLAINLVDHLIGKVTAGYVGAVAYRQFRVDASLGYRF